MKKIITYINTKHNLTAIPIKIIGTKRWASDDNFFKPEKLEGIPQRVQFNDKRGVVLYSWGIVEDSVKDDIIEEWKRLNES